MAEINELRRVQASIILPHLVRFAQLRETPTYTQIAALIGVNPHTVLPHILGFIRDSICDPRGLPRINAIVVNGNTKIPGDGFIPNSASHLTREEKIKLFKKFRDEAFSWDWSKLLEDLNLEPIPAPGKELDQEAKEYNQVMERQGGEGGEQEKHRLLKEFIQRTPQSIGISAMQKPQTEYIFLSADRCDILVELFNDRAAIVEIKVGQRGELIKGIYQLVKYRALLEAERTHGGTYSIDLYLVAYDIPQDIQNYAEKFNISCHIVKESIVK